jgi:hypothetical protein
MAIVMLVAQSSVDLKLSEGLQNDNVINLAVARDIRNYMQQANGDPLSAVKLVGQDIQQIAHKARAKLQEM